MRYDPSRWSVVEGLPALLDALGGRAGETRFVGGCVRDGLLGLPSADIDLATRLRPEQTIERVTSAGFKAVPTGLAHGTVTAVLPGGPVEVTTLRSDLSTDGRRAIVAFTDDWQEDAARRDFTINALSADPVDGTVHDYFGGLDDLGRGLVRFIGDAQLRIAEDHLRILRFFRFHARFGRGDPEPDGLAACIARANDLMALSRERIADELLKLLALPHPERTVALMIEGGIFAPILPEIDRDGARRLEWLVAREAVVGAASEPVRRLAALLPRDPALADRVAARLRLSNQLRLRLARYASPALLSAEARKLRVDRPEAEVRSLLLLADGSEDALRAGWASLEGWSPPAFPLKGGDLVAMGLRPGPSVAALLATLRRRWIELDFPHADQVRAEAAEAVAQALRATRNE